MAAQIATVEDLQSIKADIIKEVKELLDSQPKRRQWLKSEDVREMLHISHGTLQTMRINRTIPWTKIGGIIYYEHDAIIKVLEKNKRQVEK
jgi:hypothetical protein